MAYKDPETGRERGRESFRRRTAERRAQGLCPRCGIGASPRPAAFYASLVPEKRRKASRGRDAKRKAMGQEAVHEPREGAHTQSETLPAADPPSASPRAYVPSAVRKNSRPVAGFVNLAAVNGARPSVHVT